MSEAETLPRPIATSEPNAATAVASRPARLRRLARGALSRPGLTLSVLYAALVLAWALLPGLFTHQDPIGVDTSTVLKPPDGAHPFGTDELGRDVFSRVVHGTATSIGAAAVAVLVAFVVGTALGVLAGYLRGAVDDVVMRVVDVLLSVPALLVSLLLITALGFGTVNVAIAVGFASVASSARVVRAEVLRVSASPYIEASEVAGATRIATLLRHVLPNSTRPVLALAALQFGGAILAIAALSFLGFGAKPPEPQWGSIVAGGEQYLLTGWWITTLPSLVIAALVVAVSQIASALRGESHDG